MMKKFSKKVLLFLLPVLVVWIIVELFYRTVETNYTYKNEIVREYYDEGEVLIMGSSHSFYGINPEYFQYNTYNFANISQSLYFDELLLEKHLDNFDELKVVVLTIGYFTLSQEDDGLEDRWRKYFYDQQMELDVPSVSAWDMKKYSLALTRRFDKSVDLMREYFSEGTVVTSYPNGYGIQDSTHIVKDKELVARNIAKKHEDGSSNFNANRLRLNRIIERCAERKVKVLLVEMPVHKTYYNSLDTRKRRKISTLLRVLASPNENTTHVKLSQDNRFTEEDLRDADHLTNEGARKCSSILNHIIWTELSGN